MFKIWLAALFTFASLNANAQSRQSNAAPDGTGVVLVEWIRSLTPSGRPITGEFTFACTKMDSQSAYLVVVYSKHTTIEIYERLSPESDSCRLVQNTEELYQKEPQIFVEIQSALKTLDDSRLPKDRRWRLNLLIQTDLSEYFAKRSWSQKVSDFFGVNTNPAQTQFHAIRQLDFLD